MKHTTFDAAYSELTVLSQKIQSSEISVDDLSKSVKRAADLISYCKERLRSVEKDLDTLFSSEDNAE